VLSQFRAAVGRHPDDPRFMELVTALSEASPQFRDWWAEYPVGYFRLATIGIKHPRAGLITLQMFQLRLVDQPDLIEVTQIPASETSRRGAACRPDHCVPANRRRVCSRGLSALGGGCLRRQVGGGSSLGRQQRGFRRSLFTVQRCQGLAGHGGGAVGGEP
jgi:hypothetical protein